MPFQYVINNSGIKNLSVLIYEEQQFSKHHRFERFPISPPNKIRTIDVCLHFHFTIMLITNNKRMAERFKLHPETPHVKRIFKIADYLRMGKLLLLPTDSQYALGCIYTSRKGIERIRTIRKLDKDDHLTLLCDSLSGVAKFAHMDDRSFKLIKRLTPGPFTFILPATKEVPKLLVHPKKKTVGIRVPDYPICQRLIEEVGDPLLAITAKKPGMNGKPSELYKREDFLCQFEKKVDVIIDNQQELPTRETTIIDMTGEEAVIVRRDLGAERVDEVFQTQGNTLVEERS